MFGLYFTDFSYRLYNIIQFRLYLNQNRICLEHHLKLYKQKHFFKKKKLTFKALLFYQNLIILVK